MRSVIIILILIFIFSPVYTEPKNVKIPIVLTHGFLGWGRDELLGYKYWGGSAIDIQEYLKKQGFRVFTSSVGPISSNHDRACELFYQLKGGRVDYGWAHSKKFGHKRYGRKYRGMYPSWNKRHPVFLVGHSMGGQTIRVLVELLARDFFKAGSDETWVKAVVSIAAPHNGTTLATMINTYSNGFAEEIIGGFLGLAGTDWKFYDFDLDQWSLKPHKKEKLKDYLKRIDKTIGDSEDLSMFDLLPKGAKKLNLGVRNFSRVYYFSYGAEETYVIDSKPGYEWPKISMNPMLWTNAHYMGRYTGKEVSPHKRWWKNDGVVNTISMKGPFKAKIVNYKRGSLPQKGVWNYMGTIKGKDHGKVICHYQSSQETRKWLKKLYYDMARMLYNLP